MLVQTVNYERNWPAFKQVAFTRGAFNDRMINIRTRRDAWRHIASKAAAAVSCTVVLTASGILLAFGWHLDAQVRLLSVLIVIIPVNIIIAASITMTMAYRSAVMVWELQATRAQLLRISRTDPLTGLLNRRGYDEAAVALAAAGSRDNTTVVFMCDIDHFKAINDSFGHDFGDQVLVAVSKVIHAFGERHGMLTGRHGGEEFAVMMAGISELQGAKLADSLRQQCAAIRIPRGAESVTLTISIGVAAASRPTTVSAIMRDADAALYAAKRRGRNCVVRAGESSDMVA